MTITTNGTTDAYDRLAELYSEINEREAALKSLKAEREQIQRELASEFLESGTESVRRSDRTFYLRKDLFVNKASGVDTSEVVAALRKAGLEDLVHDSYAPATLKAYVKEKDEELQSEKPGASIEDELPEGLREVLNVAEVFRVIVKK